MTAPVPGGDLADPGTDPAIRATVRLLHRRRGWAWTAGGSLIALVAFFAVGEHVSPSPTGAAGIIFALIIVALAVLLVAALSIAGADTARLRKMHPAVRAGAASRVLHHPLPTYPFRTPHHRPSHAFGWIMMTLWIGLAVLLLPDEVNAVGYAIGAGSTVIFVPQSYYQSCSSRGCTDYTDGILLTHPPVRATWQHSVPLGQRFPVRQPVWDGWGSPDLMDGTSVARAMLAAMIFDVPTILILIGLLRMVRRRRRRSRGALPGTAVSWTTERRFR